MPRKKVTINKLSEELVVPVIENHIFVIRRQRVILDADLAQLYGVTTSNLNKAVQRNLERFPPDFMFELDDEEFTNLKFQTGTSSWGGRRKPPKAFSEHGAIMAANILRSKQAVQMSVYVVRAFVKLRELVSNNKRLAEKLDEIDARLDTHDSSLKELVDAVRFLLDHPPALEPKRRIGFIDGPVSGKKS